MNPSQFESLDILESSTNSLPWLVKAISSIVTDDSPDNDVVSS